MRPLYGYFTAGKAGAGVEPQFVVLAPATIDLIHYTAMADNVREASTFETRSRMQRQLRPGCYDIGPLQTLA